VQLEIPGTAETSALDDHAPGGTGERLRERGCGQSSESDPAWAALNATERYARRGARWRRRATLRGRGRSGAVLGRRLGVWTGGGARGRDDERVDVHVARLAMHFQLEAILEQIPQRELHRIWRGS